MVIEGFHRTSCTQAVERALSRRPGVARAQATFSTETLGVIRDVGFTAYTQAEAAQLRVSSQERDLRRRLARTRAGWLLGGPVSAAMVAGWVQPLPPQTVWLMAGLTTALQA